MRQKVRRFQAESTPQAVTKVLFWLLFKLGRAISKAPVTMLIVWRGGNKQFAVIDTEGELDEDLVGKRPFH